MNIDAALVARVLAAQTVARQARTVAKLAGITTARARGALILLEAVGKAVKDDRGLWRIA